MVIVELNGGLGNQLFQFAAGLSLSLHHRVSLKVNPASYDKPDPITGTQRTLDLTQFEVPVTIASESEIDNFLVQSQLAAWYEKILPFHKRSVYKEKDLTFDTEFFKSRSNLYLKGNRQSEKYFKPFEKEIRSAYIIKKEFTIRVNDFAEQIRSTNSVALHIRRGDYLTPIATDVLGLIPLNYYQTAIDLLSKKIKIDHLYLFSDDINWLENNFSHAIPSTFVSNRHTKLPIEDFYLISQCKHQVIANSTFSWWAAWLNPNPDKIVIAPKKWFNNAPYDTRDLIPDSWIKI